MRNQRPFVIIHELLFIHFLMLRLLKHLTFQDQNPPRTWRKRCLAVLEDEVWTAGPTTTVPGTSHNHCALKQFSSTVPALSRPRSDVLVNLIVDLNGSYWDADRLRIGGVLMLPVGICRGYSINLSSLICLFNCQPFPLFTRCFSTSQLSLSKSNNPCCQSPRFISHTQLDSSRLAAKLIEK
jgi:hypothetical protein